MKNIVAWEFSYDFDELEIHAYTMAVNDDDLFKELPGMVGKPVLVGQDCLYGVQISDSLDKKYVLVCKYVMSSSGLVYSNMDVNEDGWISDTIFRNYLDPKLSKTSLKN